MNIFYLHSDPILAAMYMGDKHVVKMVLETAQILSTAHRVLDDVPDDAPFYKTTHVNHPSVMWARECDGNYGWLFYHFVGLLDEYHYRYIKFHKCAKLQAPLMKSPKNIPIGRMTLMPCCMPDEYKISDDPVINYRQYYKIGKAHLHKYTKRTPPAFLSE
jgi:hypothetical protein